ncbi:hypothetical protein D3C87_1815930 [compost metagenome]
MLFFQLFKNFKVYREQVSDQVYPFKTTFLFLAQQQIGNRANNDWFGSNAQSFTFIVFVQDLG